MDYVRSILHADAVHQAGFTGRGVTAAVLDSGISPHPDYAKRIIVFEDVDYVRSILHADAVHQAGFTGRGVTAAVLDSGISPHPDYAKRIIVFEDFVNGRRECYDDASHGTHVSGILCGDGRSSRGRYCGIAPGCSLVHLKVLDRHGEGDTKQLLRAIRWVIANQEAYRIRIMNISAGTTAGEQAKSGALLVEAVEEAWDAGIVVVAAAGNQEAYRIRIMNISAGTTAGEQAKSGALLVEAVEEAWDAGIVVVAAAGNQGPAFSTITVPGNSRKIITVGAADWIWRSVGGARRRYSGCGPTRECICKPELIAPGNEVVSCSPYWKTGRYYVKKSGTSMAAPAVAGGIALLLEKEPELSNVEVKIRLKEAAVSFGHPVNQQGWGMPDLRRLLRIDGNLRTDGCI